MSGGELLRVQGLLAWYGQAQILHGLDLEVRGGEVVALMGRNGAGKSTTLKSLIGIGPRRAGRIALLGQDVSRRRPHEVARLGMGFVPEERRIFTDLTVLENLEVGRQPPRCWPDGRPAPAWPLERVLDLFPALAAMRHRPAARMSGGEQQMLTIARTLMGHPLLLLLDEPSEGVAPIVIEQLVRTVQTLKACGVGILLCEQNMQFCAQVSDRVCLLEKGTIRYQGRMQDLLDDPQTQTALLGLSP